MLKQLSIILMMLVLSACSTFKGAVESAVEQPEVKYKSLAIGEFSGDKIELKPTFAITNKNAFTIPVDNLKYQLIVNKKQLIAGMTNKIGDLPADQSKDVTLSLDVTQASLLAIKDILLKDGKLDYVIKGEVEIMGFTFPFEQKATLFKPTFAFTGLKVTNASFKQLDMHVAILVNNPNDFSLPLSKLVYGAKSKGKQIFSGGVQQQLIEKGESTIELPISIKPNELFSSVFSLLRNPDFPIDIEIDTGVMADSFSQKLNINQLLNGKR